MKKFISVGIVLFLLCPSLALAAMPASTNYTIQEYSFGAGGTQNSSSTNFNLNGITGELEFGNPTSTNFKANTGLTYLMQAAVPPSPTLSTPANNYDRIKISISTSSNPSDTIYAMQISTSSNFSSNINYVKTDNTIGPTLTTSDYKTASSWNNTFITGLLANTTYYVRVRAKQDSFTETNWGPAASATTGTATLTFSVSSNTITFSHLNSANSYTDSSQSTVLTTTTNAYNGYTVYGKETSVLTSGANTIANYASPNSTPTSWSGTGFGYTTSDNNLTGGTPNRFANGTSYAGFVTSGNGDPVADTAGPVQNAQLTNDAYTISYRITAPGSQTIGTYTNTILYTIVPVY